MPSSNKRKTKRAQQNENNKQAGATFFDGIKEDKDTPKPTLPSQRKVVDARLDKLYSKNVRCPYCKALIPKYTVKCSQCGIKKDQIARASNKEAKEIISGRAHGKVIFSKRRPEDLNYSRFLLLMIFFGMFGAHNFYCGRKRRGWVMLSFMLITIFGMIIFPVGTQVEGFMDMSSFRNIFVESGWWFPLDTPGFIAVFMWIIDWFNIVLFQRYKYPVRIQTGE